MASTMTAGAVPSWTLGDRIRKARDHANLKQAELAELTGISRASIVSYEADKTAPRRPGLAAIAMATGAPLWWLLDEPAPVSPDGGSDLGNDASAWSVVTPLHRARQAKAA